MRLFWAFYGALGFAKLVETGRGVDVPLEPQDLAITGCWLGVLVLGCRMAAWRPRAASEKPSEDAP